mmetsp:Transcript_30155/g.44569  ORF Transcript_30155/g.44569 Transcript_30155/m.44569 type:complete len:325 (-) Transcript_30155:508-1482(-)
MITLESVLESLKKLVQEEFEFPHTCANTSCSSEFKCSCAKCTKENIPDNRDVDQSKETRPGRVYERLVNELIVPLERQVENERSSHKSQHRKIPASDNDTVSDLFVTVGAIDAMNDRLDKEYHNHITKILEDTLQEISDHTGKYLHNLGKKIKPKQETVRDMINAVPSSLSYEDHTGKLPIHSTIWSPDSFEYISLLVKEGVKYNVGGECGRGGLLAEENNSTCSTIENKLNVLQLLTTVHNGTADLDLAYLETLKELRQINLFFKEDICDYRLLCFTCHPGAQIRFNYLFDWFWNVELPFWDWWPSEDSESSNSSRRRSIALA